MKSVSILVNFPLGWTMHFHSFDPLTSGIKLRDGLRIRAKRRVEVKLGAVSLSTRRPMEARPKPSANDDQLVLKEKIHDLQEVSGLSNCK